MHMHIDICLRSRQLKQLPKLFELSVKQNSNTFLSDHKQFSEITIVHEHKRVWVVWPSEITPFIATGLNVQRSITYYAQQQSLLSFKCNLKTHYFTSP